MRRLAVLDAEDDDVVQYCTCKVKALKMSSGSKVARLCTIAGSDSGGGAGIQADLKTFHSLGAYGLSVITALTAQNTVGVQAIHSPPASFVRQQFDSVASDIRIDAFKIGMLANEDIVRELGDILKAPQANGVPIVLDPVMVSTSGSMLLPNEAVQALIHKVFPQCTIVTPNVAEADEILKRTSAPESAGQSNSDPAVKLSAILRDSKAISDLSYSACLLKGGHAPVSRRVVDQVFGPPAQNGSSRNTDRTEDRIQTESTPYSQWEPTVRQATAPAGLAYSLPGSVDVVRFDHQPWSIALDRWAGSGSESEQPEGDLVVVDTLHQSKPPKGQSEWTLFVSRHSTSSSTHGTGCTLSSALATFLGQGHTLRGACGMAINYVAQCIPRGIHDLGQGPGPLDHGLTTDSLPHLRRAIPALAPNDRAPLHRALVGHDVPLWLRYTQHDFVKRILVASDATDAAFWDAFTYFLKQDYLFLQHYARMFALAAAATSASSHPDAQAEMQSFSQTAAVCMHECQKHLALCEENGISSTTVTEETKESAAVVAYTRFVLDVGHGGGGASSSGSVLPMLVAMGPCALGYAEVGLWLAQRRRELRIASNEPESYAVLHPSNRKSLSNALRHRIAYDAWIDTYSGDEFQDSVGKSIALMEKKAQQDPPTVSRLSQLQWIWTAAVRLEIGMWDEAVDPTFRREVVNPF